MQLAAAVHPMQLLHDPREFAHCWHEAYESVPLQKGAPASLVHPGQLVDVQLRADAQS